MNHPIKKGTCYVAHQGIADLHKLLNGERLIFFPESGMTGLELQIGRVYEDSIVTESAKIISCYKRQNVYIYRDGEWVNPSRQTFACSFNIISTSVLGYKSTIPSMVLGGDTAKLMRKRIEGFYQ
jgi:hypothetical protein